MGPVWLTVKREIKQKKTGEVFIKLSDGENCNIPASSI